MIKDSFKVDVLLGLPGLFFTPEPLSPSIPHRFSSEKSGKSRAYMIWIIAAPIIVLAYPAVYALNIFKEEGADRLFSSALPSAGFAVVTLAMQGLEKLFEKHM